MLPSDPKRLNHLAALASIAVALTLIAAKLGAWLITDSIVILTALVDSGIDLLASLVTLISVRQAAQPADRAHRYGHGKAEALG
ncbi:MAG: fieF, partial [Geminicoccaceae bacterium]|nr:fieF [Geminicoccaceae bacterium]